MWRNATTDRLAQNDSLIRERSSYQVVVAPATVGTGVASPELHNF